MNRAQERDAHVLFWLDIADSKLLEAHREMLDSGQGGEMNRMSTIGIIRRTPASHARN